MEFWVAGGGDALDWECEVGVDVECVVVEFDGAGKSSEGGFVGPGAGLTDDFGEFLGVGFGEGEAHGVGVGAFVSDE